VTGHPGDRVDSLAEQRPAIAYAFLLVRSLADRASRMRGIISRATADEDRRAIELTVTDAGQQAVHAWQATNAAVLHLALSTLPGTRRRALTAAVPAIDALAKAIDRLADTPSRPRPAVNNPAVT
jgi:hypothetical protein